MKRTKRLKTELTFLKLLQALECDFELVWSEERRGIIEDVDAEQRYDGHDEGEKKVCVYDIEVVFVSLSLSVSLSLCLSCLAQFLPLSLSLCSFFLSFSVVFI